MLTDNLAFRGEIRHVWMKPEFKFKEWGEKYDVRLDHFEARGGLTIYF